MPFVFLHPFRIATLRLSALPPRSCGGRSACSRVALAGAGPRLLLHPRPSALIALPARTPAPAPRPPGPALAALCRSGLVSVWPRAGLALCRSGLVSVWSCVGLASCRSGLVSAWSCVGPASCRPGLAPATMWALGPRRLPDLAARAGRPGPRPRAGPASRRPSLALVWPRACLALSATGLARQSAPRWCEKSVCAKVGRRRGVRRGGAPEAGVFQRGCTRAGLRRGGCAEPACVELGAPERCEPRWLSGARGGAGEVGSAEAVAGDGGAEDGGQAAADYRGGQADAGGFP
ncbi:hypothetical protein ACSP50_8358 [Actinoplanes sp. SE50/110]|nr:hypothetical protein ACSP50_8358 [Actinoplanes sp. SE50/110]